MHPLAVALQKLVLWACMGMNGESSAGLLWLFRPCMKSCSALLASPWCLTPVCCHVVSGAACYIMYPAQVDEVFGGKKQGAAVRTATFIVVLWIYCFEKMRASAATEEEKKVEKEDAAVDTVKGDSATKPASSNKPSRKRAGKRDKRKGGESEIEVID